MNIKAARSAQPDRQAVPDCPLGCDPRATCGGEPPGLGARRSTRRSGRPSAVSSNQQGASDRPRSRRPRARSRPGSGGTGADAAARGRPQLPGPRPPGTAQRASWRQPGQARGSADGRTDGRRASAGSGRAPGPSCNRRGSLGATALAEDDDHLVVEVEVAGEHDPAASETRIPVSSNSRRMAASRRSAKSRPSQAFSALALVLRAKGSAYADVQRQEIPSARCLSHNGRRCAMHDDALGHSLKRRLVGPELQ
jgi:hypothetical protein